MEEEHVAHGWASTCGLGAGRITIAPCLSLRTRVRSAQGWGWGAMAREGILERGAWLGADGLFVKTSKTPKVTTSASSHSPG